ncbi:LysR family transcriptional regulator [Thiohalophilus sp.]|uniref:LysR family transcriptional regulator n=1 Tax=Thiohalophilus sp. TaxID=3028392 RepID=UPI002ACD9496|nr:LysR family transcriptional regulator [Thiohalophilus sp.]MDZ7802759.1 LysR family transcriptional regulator [Thiohalophilus sp.]
MEYQVLPDINGWATLRAIVEQGGVSAAAVALNIGQPAVTKRLRALEASYGTRLMERVSGRLRLTPAGEKVYLLAVQTLDRQRALYDELRNLHLGQNTLALEVTFSIGEHLLPDLLFQFAERYPDYKIDSRMAYGRDIQSHLVTGRTDLALMENAPDHPDVLVQKWADDELWLVCGASHPLAGREWLAVEQLTELPYVLREKHASSREELDQALTGIGIEKLDVALEVGSTDTIVEMLGRGKHVSFLPRFAVKEKVSAGDLYHLKVTGFRIQRTLWIARNRSRLDHPVAEAFIDMLLRSPISYV